LYPGATRHEELMVALQRAFGVSPRLPAPPASTGGALIQLVPGPGAAPPTTPGAPAPLFVLRGRAWVAADDDGYVRWWERAEELHFQLFDTLSYKLPPSYPDARLPAPATRVELQADLAVARGRDVDVLVTAFGFDEAGAVVTRARAKAALRGSRSATATLVLAASVPMRSYRIRLLVTPRAERAGAVRMSRLRTSTAPG
jgi:hypothetical protein